MVGDPFTEFLINHPRLGEEVFQLNEEGQELLHRGRLKQAERRFREALSICEYAIPVLNNLALVSFVKKDFRRAVRRAKKVLKHHPENVFAHCTLAESFARLGRREQATSYMDRALEIYEDLGVAALPDHLNKIIEALGLLELDGKIYELYEAYGRDEDSEICSYLDPDSFFQFGVAAANLGRFQEAMQLWNRSLEDDPDLRLSELYIAAARLVGEGKAPSFRFSYGHEGLEDLSELDPHDPPLEVKPLLVATIWESEEGELRSGAIDFLGQYEDPWAERFLFLLLRQPELPDNLKIRAGFALIEQGALEEGEKVEAHFKGRLRKVILTRSELPAEPPPEAADLFQEGLRLKREGDLEGAERSYREALELYPIFVPAKVNLANICRSSGRLDEAEQLLEEAIELEGGPTAFLNLAALYVQREEYDQAVEVLAEFSPDDLEEGRSVYHQLQGYIHLRRREFNKAQQAFQEALRLDPDNPVLKEELKRAEAWRWVRRGLKRHERLEERRRKRYLGVPVSSEISLEKALSNLTKDNLTGMARELGVPYGGLRKAALVEEIAGYLKENAKDIYQRLKPREKEVLRWIVGKGGSASYRGLTGKYGSTREDSIDWYYRAPSSVVGRLCFMGLLFAGKDEHGKTIAVIPQEILGQLAG